MALAAGVLEGGASGFGLDGGEDAGRVGGRLGGEDEDA